MLDSLRFVIRVLFAGFCIGLFNGCTSVPAGYLASPDPLSTRNGTQTVQSRPSETIAPSINLPTTELITSMPNPLNFRYEIGNLLFVFHDGYLTLFDTFTHEQERVNFPLYCRSGLSPHSELLYCEKDSTLLLLNPISKESQLIRSGINPDIHRSSPGGEYLILIENTDDSPMFIRYNIATKEMLSFQIGKNSSDDLSFPIISNNGKSVAYIKRSSQNKSKIIIKNIETVDNQEFSINDVDELQLISWFPNSTKILVGASNLNTDMPGYLNYLYILDVETNVVRSISKAHNEFPYEYMDFVTSPNILSPNGELILMPSDRGVCVISVLTEKQSCFDFDNADHIKSFDWSPNSDKVAVVARSINSSDIIFILTSEDMSVNEINELSAINITHINWR